MVSAVLERHRHGVARLRRAGELHAGLEGDLALAEGRARAVLEMASSSAATSRGSASTMVTSEPNDWNTDANSTPMTPPPEDDDARRDEVEGQRLLAGHDPAGDLEPGQRLGVGAGGEHDVAAADPAAADLDGGAVDQAAGALDQLDLVGLRQTLQALVETGDDAVLVGVDAATCRRTRRSTSRRTARPRGRCRRPRRRAAAPWSGCSRRAGRCRPACPSRRARPRARARRPGTRTRNRHCLLPGSPRHRACRHQPA